MPDHPGDRTLVELWDKASESGTTDLPPHPDESDGTAALCEHAWLLMARSSFVKAQALLENLRRSDPDATRVADLLWALEGDFLAREPIGSLAARLGPSLALLTDVGDPEHTEAASKAEIAAALAPDDKSTSGMFPGLFRNTTAEDELLPGAAPGAEEVTKITRMSEIERIAENQEFISDFGDTASSGDDTQILLVVHRGENKAPPTTEEVDNSFDLGAIKREMRAHGSDDIRHLEGEDDDIIIHTRVEDTAELEPDPTTDVSILELHHENPSAEAAQLVDEAAEWVKRRPVHHLSAQATHPMVQRRDKHRRSASRNVPRWTFWAAAGATAVIFGIAAIGLVVLVRLLFGLIL
jgi:hypothetical protein